MLRTDLIEDKYEVLERMNEGGMGEIYLVQHRLLEEKRVIKQILPDHAMSEVAQKRFMREAKAAAQLRHPNIAQLFDFSMAKDGTALMVMEYIEGRDLAQLIDDFGPMDIGLAIDVGRQGLIALDVLHKAGFVHRDIAPDNLMLTLDYDGNPLVKLIDLGIVKNVRATDVTGGVTAAGNFVGKARYVSPELLRADGGADVSAVSDIYSFGVVLYEILTGVCPIAGKSFAKVLSNQLFNPPLSFDETDPSGAVPQPLRELVLEALAKAPEDRIQTAIEFHERLTRLRQPIGLAPGELPAMLAAEDVDRKQTVKMSEASAGVMRDEVEAMARAAAADHQRSVDGEGDGNSVEDVREDVGGDGGDGGDDADAIETDALPTEKKGGGEIATSAGSSGTDSADSANDADQRDAAGVAEPVQAGAGVTVIPAGAGSEEMTTANREKMPKAVRQALGDERSSSNKLVWIGLVLAVAAAAAAILLL